MKKTIRKAFKFQLKVTPQVSRQLANFAGGSRFVWNKALALNLDRLEHKEPLMWYQELNFWATLWKQSDEYSFLKELPSQAIQQKLKDLETAFKDAFDKNQPLKRMPVFKKKGQPSQICPSCLHVAKENRLTQAEFVCVECGFSENADLVGAMNVLAKGHALLAGKQPSG
ncbi:MAG: helix-turn-helix domain-containing protein [Methylobacter sp.]|uniref:Helix-turn-helix domain-containing protein n=1 Tax=Candidatus Methylobacter titanis TaxID=3053457 RepID=A0AA43Q846_9GAMM|nr:helix-turn-helix domain-containing protein [Candidatus Methylobacter titanis]MDI1293265.1 helix-turn-helix domain-containing protein [Candidatus Methylobacter titanis]